MPSGKGFRAADLKARLRQIIFRCFGAFARDTAGFVQDPLDARQQPSNH
jgi:hypothetical protein